jgi:hypothetical protein
MKVSDGVRVHMLTLGLVSRAGLWTQMFLYFILVTVMQMIIESVK